MKRLGGVREKSMPLNAVSLDLRSPAGKTTEGYFRLIVNAIADRQGRMRRLGGWKALSLTTPGNRVNEDLHDQLITNTKDKVTVVAPTSAVQVLPFTIASGSLGIGESSLPTVTVSGLTCGAGSPTAVFMPTISVTPLNTGYYWNGYEWRTNGKTYRSGSSINPCWYELNCYAPSAGGYITVRFYTRGTVASDSEVYVYGCAPADATLWTDIDNSDGVTPWSPFTQTPTLFAPVNTNVPCTP